MKNISKGKAGTIPIMLPPKKLQEKFAEVVQRTERIRAQQREADRQAEHLFQTLLHKAFLGELNSDEVDISVVPVEIAHDQSASLPGMPEHVGRDSYQLALPLE